MLSVRRRRSLRWAVGLLVPLILIGAGIIAAYSLRTPPLDTLATAYLELQSARAAGAQQYARATYEDAVAMLQLGEQALAEENARWLPISSYRLADSLLQEAATRARHAAGAATARRQTRQRQTEYLVTNVTVELTKWRRRLNVGLTLMNCERLWYEARLNVNLATQCLHESQHDLAESHANRAADLLARLSEQFEQYQHQNSERVERWHQWVRETQQASAKTGKTAIIVDKFNHRLLVLKGGEVVDSYPCDLGFNSAHQKQRAGDGATPEGKYRVAEVSHRSKYYKALLLNYPNGADLDRFRQN
ncbi:MAG: L,D-transpeptidase family protein, partial [Candidatus Zixiibacteriota bacterium]